MNEKQKEAVRNTADDFVKTMSTIEASMATLVEDYENPKRGEPWPLSRLEIPGMGDLVTTYQSLSRGLWGLLEIFPDVCQTEHPHGGPDLTQAWIEGWTICHYDEDENPSIQRCDDPSSFLPCLGFTPRFDCDEAAARFVAAQAESNPEGYHARIMAYLGGREKSDAAGADL